MAEYPRMTCRKHGDSVQCYIVCSHVVAGEATAFNVEHPDEHPGLIVCKACSEIPRPLKNVETFAPICALCAAEQGWITNSVQ